MGPSSFPILDIDPWTPDDDEPLGSKVKGWFRDPEGQRWLFKEVRGLDRPQGPEGEDWAEKIAAELARAMGIPAAIVELATRNGRRGIVSLAVLDEGETLVHGDELLEELDPTYDRFQLRAAVGMTVAAVWRALDDVVAAPGTSADLAAFGAPASMASYLVFDALIGNTDRHHSNWAVIRREGRPDAVAPTFDHASSLGFNVTAVACRRRLAASDPAQGVEAFARRGRGKFEGAAVLVDLAAEAVEAVGARARSMLCEAVVALGPEVWDPIVEAIPDALMSHDARTFATRLLAINQDRLRHALDC